MASAWPAYERSAIAQWCGLTEQERREVTDCLRRGRINVAQSILVTPQFHVPIWTVETGRQGCLVLIGIKA